MSRYRTIDVRMHGDEVVASLSRPQPNARSLWDHLLYGPSTGIVPGLYRMREVQMADELGWELEPFREVFTELSTARSRLGLDGVLATADWKAGLVWVPNAVKYNAPANPNVVMHWADALDELPECALKVEAFLSLRKHCEGRKKGFLEAFDTLPKPLHSSFRNRSANQPPNQDQDQEQDQEQERVAAAAVGKPFARTHAPLRAYVKQPESVDGPALPAALAPSPAAAPDFSSEEFSEEAMANEFSEVYFSVRDVRPNLRGHVNGLLGEVREVAKARNADPRDVFVSAARRWCEGEHNPTEKKFPYACFAAAFGAVIGSVSDASADERTKLFQRSNDALKRGDVPAYEAAERDIAAFMEGQGRHAAAS